MDDKKVSLIEFAAPFKGHDRGSWPSMIQWLVQHVIKMEKAFDKEVPDLRQLARNRYPKETTEEWAVS